MKRSHLHFSSLKLKVQCVMVNFLGQLYWTEKCLGHWGMPLGVLMSSFLQRVNWWGVSSWMWAAALNGLGPAKYIFFFFLNLCSLTSNNVQATSCSCCHATFHDEIYTLKQWAQTDPSPWSFFFIIGVRQQEKCPMHMESMVSKNKLGIQWNIESKWAILLLPRIVYLLSHTLD